MKYFKNPYLKYVIEEPFNVITINVISLQQVSNF